MRDNEAFVREVHDKGLAYDLPVMTRRRMLTIGGAGALTVAGGGTVLGGTVLGGAGKATAACAAEVDSETAGPYPADGSNGPNVRVLSGIVRSDIRSSFGTSTTTTANPASVTKRRARFRMSGAFLC